MNIKLENYLYKYFPELFPTKPSLQCDNGWFYLILWTCRYIHSYKEIYDNLHKDKPLDQPEILQIKNKDGLLNIKLENSNEILDSFIESIKFLSGFICEKNGNHYNNLIDITDKKTINKKFLEESHINKYIDNKELRDLVSEIF